MQDIFMVVKKLRDEKVSLEKNLEMMSQRTEQEEKRLIKDLNKSRIDLENLSDLFRDCADGIDTKSTSSIPELPEAAVAKVVPRGLRPLLEGDYGDHDKAGSNIAQEIGYARAATTDAVKQYERMSEAGKGLVWDVERLSMIIQAYETDLINLREAGSDVKATINRARISWRTKFSACRRWQDFTRRSCVLKHQEELDRIQDQLDYDQANNDKELEALLEMIGTMKARNNHVKLTLFMKKMKNALLFKMWRGWGKFHQLAVFEKLGLDMDNLSEEEAAKIAAMVSKEREAMLKQFLKRWQLRKIAVPFSSWADIMRKKRVGHVLTEAERQHAAMLSKMQALEGSAVAQKLSLIFAKMAGKMRDLTFRALVKNAQVGRIARLCEDEKFKRLKVFLERKIKGVKFATFKCLERESDQLAMKRIKNNECAKRVGAFLEMKMKGIKFAQFNSFKRYAKDAALERDEEDRLAKLIAQRDSQSLHRLRVFLQGKEARMKYTMFSYWKWLTTHNQERIMEKILAEKRKQREDLETKLRKLEHKVGIYSHGDLEGDKASAESSLRDMLGKEAALGGDLEAAKKKLKDTEEQLRNEQDARRSDVVTIKRLTGDLEDARVDKEGLEQELALIVDQIGFLNTYSK